MIKILLMKLTFHIQDVQHREWFIAELLSHIHVPLTQQKGDDPGGGHGDYDVPKSYTKRSQDIGKANVGTISARKSHHAITRYG
jgi:hypothetical protein